MAAKRIGILGCGGRMGRMLIRAVQETPGCALAGGVDRPGSEAIGEDLGILAGLVPLGLVAGTDPRAIMAESEAVLEFTTPEATVHHAALAAEAGTVHVIGTTGLTGAQAQALARAAERATIVWAPNMSLGVTLLTVLVERVSRALDPRWDIEIVEMHHRAKADAPSGTALALGRAAAAGRGVDLGQVAARGRDGITGPRAKGSIGFAALRGGDVVGEHRVIFAADGERVEIDHVATDRAIFARGAVTAAVWAIGRPPGLYSMSDVLGLSA